MSENNHIFVFLEKEGRTKMKNQVEELCLRPWQEIVGTCVDAIQDTATTITLVIEIVPKAQKLKLSLHNLTVRVKDLVGQPIAIIRTDDNERPFLVRRLKDPTILVRSEQKSDRTHSTQNDQQRKCFPMRL